MSDSRHDGTDANRPAGEGVEGTAMVGGPAAVAAGLVDRLRRVFRMDEGVYEELASDIGAIPQALAIVAATSLIVGLGSLSISGIFGGMAWAIVMWLVSSGMVWLVANAVSDDAVPYAALLRGLGFAYAWFALFLFNALPLIGWLISLAALVLTVLSGVYAVRACMHVSTGKAALVCALSILTPLLLLKLLF